MKQEPVTSPPIKPTPPAGWYPDAVHLGNEQWWDGVIWTGERRAVNSGTPPVPNFVSPPETVPVFLPKTRMIATITACLHVIWALTFGAVLLVVFGMFFSLLSSATEQAVALLGLLIVVGFNLSPVLLLVGIRQSSRIKVAVGGMCGATLPSFLLAALTHYDAVNNWFALCALIGIVGYLAPVVEAAVAPKPK